MVREHTALLTLLGRHHVTLGLLMKTSIVPVLMHAHHVRKGNIVRLMLPILSLKPIVTPDFIAFKDLIQHDLVVLTKPKVAERSVQLAITVQTE